METDFEIYGWPQLHIIRAPTSGNSNICLERNFIHLIVQFPCEIRNRHLEQCNAGIPACEMVRQECPTYIKHIMPIAYHNTF